MYFYMYYRQADVSVVGLMNSLQMGNLGYSSALCRDVHLGVGKIMLTCETGVIKDVVAFGIIPEHAKIRDACLPNRETEDCDEIIKEDEAINMIEEKCLSKNFCSFDILPLLEQHPQSKPKCFIDCCKANDEQEIGNRKTIQTILVWSTIITSIVYYLAFELLDRISESKLEEYDQLTTTCSDFTAIYKIPEELYQNFKVNIYPEYNEELHTTVGRTFPVINAFKYYMIEGFERILSEDEPLPTIENKLDCKRVSLENQKLELDYETHSEVQNTERHNFTNQKVDNVIKLWRKSFNDDQYKTNKTVKLEKHKFRSKTIQDQSNCPSTLNNFFLNRSKDFKIAEIQFSFKNREVLDLLEQRGNAILEGNHQQKKVIEDDISNLIVKKNDDLCTPVAAFITFENEESYLKATEINKIRLFYKEYYKKYWEGYPLYFKPALEPSSILWENQYVPNQE